MKTFFDNTLDNIEKKLSYFFKDKSLALIAFTHSSFINEQKKLKKSNETLEFLGDSILNLILSEYLYLKYPEKPEGTLSKYRSQIVSGKSCYLFLKKLDVQNYLLCGKGEKKSKRGEESILADLFEAIIGAIYLDSGLEEVKGFFFNHFENDLKDIIMESCNYKDSIQRYFQKKYKKLPEYKVIEETGPDHKKKFKIGLFFEGSKLSDGIGLSRSKAESLAAKKALENI